ncbi:MAG: HD-GYP domain-containing protein [Thermodesulfobacteriota bacterium]
MNELQSDMKNFEEEYYQISADILQSFPKFRLPLNLYHFKEDSASLVPYYYADERLSKEKQAELYEFCENGIIFVARSDHHIYAKHISRQLDLVLVDSHLQAREIALIFRHALTDDIINFFDQPVKPAFEKLKHSIEIFTEYIFEDKYRIKNFYSRLHPDYSLEKAAFNAGILGTSIYMQMQSDIKKKYLDQAALGFFIYDLGMAKIPKFIREKKQNLTPQEQQKFFEHPNKGTEILQKFGTTETLTIGSLLEHHERLDGSGTPRGLKGAEISISGRIAGVVDTFIELTLAGKQHLHTAAQATNIINSNPSKFDSKVTGTMQNIMLLPVFNKT